MSDDPKCTPETPWIPEAGFVREVALIHLPKYWRNAVRDAGIWAFDASMERWGIAPETTDTEGMTAARIDAVIDDLRCLAQYLTELGAEEGQSEMRGPEIALCKLSGRFGRQVAQIAGELEVAADSILEGDD